MMKMQKYLGLILLSLSMACEKSDSSRSPQLKKGADAYPGGNPSLILSWQGPKSPLSSYHVFFQAGPGKNLEIDSLSESEANVRLPSIVIDRNNLESWPPAGSEACFFIVADNQGSLSEPSDKACITI